MTLRVATVQHIVARYYGISRADMLSDRKPQSIARPRMVAMYLAREFTDCSLPALGRLFGKDHSTIVHGIHRIPRLNAEWLRHDLAVLRERLRRVAELAELDALSGRVYLAAEQQVEWIEGPHPRKCIRCHEAKLDSEFRNLSDSWCRECRRSYDRDYKARRREARLVRMLHRTDVAIPSALR